MRMGYTGFGKVKVKNIKNVFSANFRYVCEALIRRVKFSKQENMMTQMVHVLSNLLLLLFT